MATVQEGAEQLSLDDKCYIDTDTGADDSTADGSEAKPFKSLGHAYIASIDRPGVKFQTRASKTGDDAAAASAWKDPAKSAAKKAQNMLDAHKKKLDKQSQSVAAEEEARKQRTKNLEEAKFLKITADPSLPKATRISIGDKSVELGDATTKGKRVVVMGRIHRLRQQKQATFITLIDGYGHLQCVIPSGPMTKTYDALTFAQGTALALYGELKKLPEGATAPDGRELQVDYYEVLGSAPGDAEAITNKVSSGQDPWESDMLDSRHLILRGDNASSLMKVRSELDFAFRYVYRQLKFRQVSPPALVQTQVEGGSTLFKFGYYGEDAYLTQSSQLYLETVLPSMGNVYCIEKSFRAEKSLTRRHLAEYTHVEAELDFLTFDDLLNHIEDLICSVVDYIHQDPEIAAFIKQLNPGLQRPKRPFKRMRYSDAIDWLNAQKEPILNEDGEPHKFGDDIAEAAERKMTDAIGETILLTHFPVEIKAFYMKRDPTDLRVTESVDVLMPGVGEIVGGSMRMEDYHELEQGFKRHQIDPTPYYWYMDQRKYGTSNHGGYGLGMERFLAWLTNQHSVRTCCMYPRFMGRCKP